MASATFDDSLKILIIVGAVDEDCKVTPILTAVKSGLCWSKKTMKIVFEAITINM